ncbi:hypothetical protein [Ensifer adhaerens]|uniref:hypothetical protein n=1 Tax=Ensifer adhaerens TaxID=106592 RepID=UPI0015C357FC|nr:hypothetical protein [Ensifer adhaerens]
MRRSCLAMALAMTSALAFAMPAKAANYSYGCKPSCIVKTGKTYGAFGRVVIRKVRVCN